MLYTLSQSFILRNDPRYREPFLLFDINSGKRYSLSPMTYAVLRLFELNAMSIEQLGRYLDRKYDRFTFSEVHDFTVQLVEQGVVQPARIAIASLKKDMPMSNRTISGSVPVAEYPIYAEIHFTNACNLACRHCAYDAGRKLEEQLTAGAWAEVLDELESLKTFEVQLSGGEPLLLPGIEDLLGYIAEKRIRVNLLTNGTLIDEDIAELLAAQNFSTIVSLDGATPSVHSILRGTDAFERTVAGLRNLAVVDAEFHISTTLHRKNQQEIDPIMALACELGAKSINFSILDSVGRAVQHKDLLFRKSDVRKMTKRIEDLKKAFGGSLQIGFLDPADPDLPEYDADNSADTIYCSAGTSRVAIRSDGNVFPCVYAFHDDRFCMGRVANNTLADIWRDNRWGTFRGKTLVRDLLVCTQCDLLNSCILKSCRLRSYHANGDFYGCPPGCPRSIPDGTKLRAQKEG